MERATVQVVALASKDGRGTSRLERGKQTWHRTEKWEKGRQGIRPMTDGLIDGWAPPSDAAPRPSRAHHWSGTALSSPCPEPEREDLERCKHHLRPGRQLSVD